MTQIADSARSESPRRKLSHVGVVRCTENIYRSFPESACRLKVGSDLVQTITLWVLLFLLIAAGLAAGYLFWAKLSSVWPFPQF